VVVLRERGLESLDVLAERQEAAPGQHSAELRGDLVDVLVGKVVELRGDLHRRPPLPSGSVDGG
jgi:hypothetical protein